MNAFYVRYFLSWYLLTESLQLVSVTSQGKWLAFLFVWEIYCTAFLFKGCIKEFYAAQPRLVTMFGSAFSMQLGTYSSRKDTAVIISSLLCLYLLHESPDEFHSGQYLNSSILLLHFQRNHFSFEEQKIFKHIIENKWCKQCWFIVQYSTHFTQTHC